MATPTERILVTGANGKLGRRLLQALREKSPPIPVRALVRSMRAANSLSDLAASGGPQVRVVDYADANAMAQAAEGCSHAVHLVGILKETRHNRYATAHEATARALAAASDAASLRGILHTSIHGADENSPNPCLSSRGRSDAILLAARTPALILRVPMVLGAGDAASAANHNAIWPSSIHALSLGLLLAGANSASSWMQITQTRHLPPGS